MAVFSTNQVRQLYVANSYDSVNNEPNVTGAIKVKGDNAKSHVYFKYMGADNLMRSDLIDVKNILHVKATNAEKMAHPLKAVLITLDGEVNGGTPIAGQDYILRIAFKQFAGMSDEDQYFKYGMVHAYSTMNASKFYAKLAESLANNFSRETTKLVSIHLVSGESQDVEEGEVLAGGKIKDSGTSAITKIDAEATEFTGVLIEEVAQPWRLGIIPQSTVDFEVFPSTVVSEGDELIWGIVKETESDKTIKNGQLIADLEHFCMGERGDVYRGAGYPNNIVTKYLVDPSKAYHTLDIHYAYVGSNEAVQKSEKDITIVSSDKAVLNQIITQFNSATGLTVAQL